MKIIPALLTLVFATALTCRADVISQTVDFGTITGGSQFYFNQFNTALGTLTGVTLDWTVNSSITAASITNENAGTVTISRISFTNTVEGFVPSTGTSGDLVAEVANAKSITPAGGTVTLNPGETYNYGSVVFNGFTQTDSYTSADANFTDYQGTGTVPLYLANTFGATPTASGSGSTTSWLTSITGSTTGNLQVTYTYTAAPIAPVPEPPAILLGFGGILGMAGFAFKRRAKNTTAAAVA
ncbi:MAG: choice-of-anchor E domain-containing protein [Prosthecobacter sp.]|uniref:choice-of-anchor E domain-containing protein n=1 Tax=Prosthecobacter sp. TaxID=1965333 RepID=UPI0025FCCCD3|nr:choice-of-anchor E domain-containing protein [Prosthecobacter sp.]MCF7787545.1 choice-of-anchor E domain-containing protein [Prosthecobacter sp.]